MNKPAQSLAVFIPFISIQRDQKERESGNTGFSFFVHPLVFPEVSAQVTATEILQL
jgi:hypothetical protein